MHLYFYFFFNLKKNTIFKIIIIHKTKLFSINIFNLK